MDDIVETLASFEALVPIVTLGIGWFLARSREREKERQDQRLEVYAEMLNVMALVERSEFTNIVSRMFAGETLEGPEVTLFNNVVERHNQAHLRLMVFGSKDVIRAVSKFYRADAPPLSNESKSGYIEILTSMRRDGFQKLYNELSEDIDNVLVSGPFERRTKKLQQALQADQENSS